MRVSHSVMDREDGDVTGTVCAKDDCHNPRASSPTTGQRVQALRADDYIRREWLEV